MLAWSLRGHAMKRFAIPAKSVLPHSSKLRDAQEGACSQRCIHFFLMGSGSETLFVEINLDSDLHQAFVRKHSPESP